MDSATKSSVAAPLAWKRDGLTDEQLRVRAVPPSTMSLLGLVRHMADVEAHWFRRILSRAETPKIYCSDADPDGDFDDVGDADVEHDFGSGAPSATTRAPSPPR